MTDLDIATKEQNRKRFEFAKSITRYQSNDNALFLELVKETQKEIRYMSRLMWRMGDD